MITGFRDKATQDLYVGENTKEARKIPRTLWPIAKRKLDVLHAAPKLDDLRQPPGNRLEKLRADLEGFHSIRINDQYRLIFVWENGNASRVQITDYHE